MKASKSCTEVSENEKGVRRAEETWDLVQIKDAYHQAAGNLITLKVQETKFAEWF